MLVTTREIVTFNDKTGVVFVDFACRNEGNAPVVLTRDLFLQQEISFNQCVGVGVVAAEGNANSGFKISVPASEAWGVALMNTNQDEPIVLGGAFSRPFAMGESGTGKARFSMNMVKRHQLPYRGRAKVRLAFEIPAQCSLAITAVADVTK